MSEENVSMDNSATMSDGNDNTMGSSPSNGLINEEHRNSDLQPNKKEKRGVIYLSSIPEGLNPRNVRMLLGRYGEIDRIYFEPEKMRKRVPYTYKEGWIEFKKKRIAKEVAVNLNATPISTKRKSKLDGVVWTMKYLHRFKWSHLIEQMNYEKITKNQRLRLEMGRVRREADFYAEQMDVLRHRQKKGFELDEESIQKRSTFYETKQKPVATTSSQEQNVDTSLLDKIFT